MLDESSSAAASNGVEAAEPLLNEEVCASGLDQTSHQTSDSSDTTDSGVWEMTSAKLSFVLKSNDFLGFTESTHQYGLKLIPPSISRAVQPYDLLQHESLNPSTGAVDSIALESKKFPGVYLCCEQRQVCAKQHPREEESRWRKWGFKEIYPDRPYPSGNEEAILLQFYGEGYKVDPRRPEERKKALFLIHDGKVCVAPYITGYLYGTLVLS